MKQKTLLLLAQNPLDFETYRNRANGWFMSQAPTDGNTERWSKPRAVCLAATMKVVVWQARRPVSFLACQGRGRLTEFFSVCGE